MTGASAERRERAISEAAAAFAAIQAEIHELHDRGGPRAVAEAACPGGSEEQLQRLTEKAERWAAKAAALPPLKPGAAQKIAALTTDHEHREGGNAA